jgi:mono/diheme cytochrome c family protein
MEGAVGVRSSIAAGAALALFALAGCNRHDQTKPPQAEVADPNADEAKAAGRTPESFVHAGEDYFHDMDGGVTLDAKEIAGRNMWLVWSGGNDRFWDYMRVPTNAGFDLLKIAASPPNSKLGRPNRWKWLGAINEPCFHAPTKPDRFGIWVDERDPTCPPDPFADEKRYPGVKTGARGTVLPKWGLLPIGSYYGYPTGIIGLRLFPNPAFDEKAARAWDPVRYYNDPTYYNRTDIVRPYRVGMSCGFCHVGPSPTKPPADPANPKFANLSSTVGAQYLWADRFFIWDQHDSDFVSQWVRTFRPGALDTSLVSSDNINNPRTMNALYNVEARLRFGGLVHREQLKGGSADNKQFNNYIQSGWLTTLYDAGSQQIGTPHVLKDGADSVGALGALNRVYLNIGLYSEDWLKHFKAVTGGLPVSPIRIAFAEQHSTYWKATEAGTPATALFFLAAAKPDLLKAAPGGATYADPPALVQQGLRVFSDTCARCHSSKGPRPPENARLTSPGASDYLVRFRNWWRWTETDDFKQQMWAIASRPDFLAGNYMSTDARIPVTLLRTNLCSPLATNALRDNIWDNFSSETYKNLPSVGVSSYRDPFTGEVRQYSMPAGGRGFTRPPSLISLWSTAPFLLNNSVGPFYQDPSVTARMRSFNASIVQMLWPERRALDTELGARAGGWIDRTTARSAVVIPIGTLPHADKVLDLPLQALLRQLADRDGNIRLGVIPKGMPVNLLVNLRPLAESNKLDEIKAHYRQLLSTLLLVKRDLASLPQNASDPQLRQHFANLRGPLMNLSKCPDFVVNRGHYFGTRQFNDPTGLTADELLWLGKPGVAGQSEPELSDAQKRALIAFLKTL